MQDQAITGAPLGPPPPVVNEVSCPPSSVYTYPCRNRFCAWVGYKKCTRKDHEAKYHSDSERKQDKKLKCSLCNYSTNGKGLFAGHTSRFHPPEYVEKARKASIASNAELMQLQMIYAANADDRKDNVGKCLDDIFHNDSLQFNQKEKEAREAYNKVSEKGSENKAHQKNTFSSTYSYS